MKLIWLGQAGFIFIANNGTKIMIDPYLSNTLYEKHGATFKREISIKTEFLSLDIDILILTHNHYDHTDYSTLELLLSRNNSVTILSPINVWQEIKERYGKHHMYYIFAPGTEITVNNILFCSKPAFHSDINAIGVVIICDNKTIYHTGDTLYNNNILTSIDTPLDALIVPINGYGNNMNVIDAVRLTYRLLPKKVIPIHWDMFKSFGCNVNDFTTHFPDGSNIEPIVLPHYEEYSI